MGDFISPPCARIGFLLWFKFEWFYFVIYSFMILFHYIVFMILFSHIIFYNLISSYSFSLFFLSYTWHGWVEYLLFFDVSRDCFLSKATPSYLPLGESIVQVRPTHGFTAYSLEWFTAKRGGCAKCSLFSPRFGFCHISRVSIFILGKIIIKFNKDYCIVHFKGITSESFFLICIGAIHNNTLSKLSFKLSTLPCY